MIDSQQSLQTAERGNTYRLPFTLTFHPHNHAVKYIIFKKLWSTSKQFRLVLSFCDLHQFNSNVTKTVLSCRSSGPPPCPTMIDSQQSLQTAERGNTYRLPFTLTFHPHNHAVKYIIFKKLWSTSKQFRLVLSFCNLHQFNSNVTKT